MSRSPAPPLASPTSGPTASPRSCAWPTPSPRWSGGPSPRSRPCGARWWPRSSSRSRPGPGSPSRRRPSGCRPTCSPSPWPARRSRRASRLRDTVETVEAMGIDAVIIRHSSAGAPHQVAALGRPGPGDQRRRRLARAPDPGAARLLHRAPGPGRAQGRGARGARHRLLRGPAGADRRATSATAGWPAPRSWPTPPSEPRSPWWRRAPCCRPRSRAGRSRWPPTSTTCWATPTWSPCSGCRPSGGAASFVPSLREYTAGYGLTARRAERLRRATPSSPIPGPMVRGVEIASDVADLPAHRDHPAGEQRRGRADGRPLPAARRRAAGRGGGAGRCLSPRLVIRGGTVVDPTGLTRGRRRRRRRRRGRGGRDHRRAARGARCSTPAAAWSAPGLVDLHTHLRQPGREEAETIETGARAAALGGYTAVVAMPNTEPAIDSAGVVREVLALGAGCTAEVAVAGAITVGPGRRARWPRWASWPPSACASSPTTAPACRTARSCAGPSTTPRASASPWPSTARTTAWPPAAPCTRAAWSSRLGHPGHAGGGRGGHGGPRHRAGRA